jgi:D-alanine-D-alanine ligase
VTTNNSAKVLVLTGGRSAERDVSLSSGAAICRALHEAGFEVLLFDPATSRPPVAWNPESGMAAIDKTPPDPKALVAEGLPFGVAMTPADVSRADLNQIDLVFIALHGGDGENGRLQALLDTCGVHYTGSGMAASALAMDKHAAKRIFRAEEIPTPRWRILDRGDDMTYGEATGELGTPLIVKPNAQGSTVGLTLVREKAQWADALAEGFRWDERLIVEEYIAGREITVGVLGDRALPVVEITPTHDLYDYECKYTSGRSSYTCPADLTAEQTARVQELGLRAFRALDCRGYARTDFRMSDDGQFYCLEVNTLPGMTSTSLVPKAARAAGMSFEELLRQICELAM